MRLQKFLAVLLLSVCCLSNACANDARITGVGGRWQRLNDEKTSVRMVREWIKMRVNVSSCDVEATFVFRNDGKATRVAMGFPESGDGVDAETFKNRSGFKRFAVWIDGRRTQVQRDPAQKKSNGYKAFWKKEVSFRARQTRRVRVEYSSDPGREAAFNELICAYTFAEGYSKGTKGKWKGKISQSDVRIEFRRPEAVALKATLYRLGIPLKLRQRGARFSHRWTNRPAEGNFEVRIVNTLPGWLREKGAVNTFLDDGDAVYEPRLLHGHSHLWRRLERGLQVDLLPSAFLRDGELFVWLTSLVAPLSPSSKEMWLEWNKKSGEALLTVDSHRFTFRPGSKQAKLDNRVIELPSACVLLRGHSNDARIYIPVAPLLKILNGRAVIDAKTHRYEIQWAKPRYNNSP